MVLIDIFCVDCASMTEFPGFGPSEELVLIYAFCLTSRDSQVDTALRRCRSESVCQFDIEPIHKQRDINDFNIYQSFTLSHKPLLGIFPEITDLLKEKSIFA
jgi:hypothetical protein